ncbi:MAG: protein kinase domain-containing protein, partial [Thermocrispum sp.]
MTRRKRETPSASDADLAPGELVPLADGPVAGVLAGVDHVTGEAFALKVYPGKLDRAVRTELEAELSRLFPLRSRAPVLVADRVQSHHGHCALRMELCAQSLPELVSSFGPLSVSDALALGESVATALAVAHRAGVVHGGVTPGNVLFRPSGEAVLSDFGLALRTAFP